MASAPERAKVATAADCCGLALCVCRGRSKGLGFLGEKPSGLRDSAPARSCSQLLKVASGERGAESGCDSDAHHHQAALESSSRCMYQRHKETMPRDAVAGLLAETAPGIATSPIPCTLLLHLTADCLHHATLASLRRLCVTLAERKHMRHAIAHPQKHVAQSISRRGTGIPDRVHGALARNWLAACLARFQ